MDHEEGKKVLVISHRHLISWGKKSFPTSNAGTRAHPSHLNSVFPRPFELTGAGLTWRHPYLET